jgi:hypothetical protein
VNYDNKKPVGIELTEIRNNLKTGVVSQVSKEGGDAVVCRQAV